MTPTPAQCDARCDAGCDAGRDAPAQWHAMEGHRARAWAAWRKLGSPRHICAPMVRGSELAFRELVRKHGVQVAYGPMLRASAVVEAAGDPEAERQAGLDVLPRERDVYVAQLAGRDPAELLAAGRILQDRCAAVDINLGCPQACAEKGRFGAFLLREPDLVEQLVRVLASGLSVPVWCKMRVLDSPEATVALAMRVEAAGCSLLALHGRTREARHDGEVDWDTVRAVVEALGVPVLANGGVRCREDADEALARSGAAGVLLASGLLSNPRMLHTPQPQTLQTAIDLAAEYLDYTAQFPPPSFMYQQVHLRHLLRSFLKADSDPRWWSLLCRPWMQTNWQFFCLLRLLALGKGLQPPDLSRRGSPVLETFRDLRKAGREALSRQALALSQPVIVDDQVS